MAPVTLREKLVIVDDIERKQNGLGMDEVMGFIDEYSKRYKTRFVLILNDDQLETSHKQSWRTLHEKVIDHGLKLNTSPEEAFSIAIDLSPSPFEDALKRASIICGLTNIRIIKQVIKAANRILGPHRLDDTIIERVIPSVVLFSAIHYRGLTEGPDMQFALNIGSLFDWDAHKRKERNESTEEDKRVDSWRLLMRELNIITCDDFEATLVDFLESGLFEADRIKSIIERYKLEHETLRTREIAQRFLHEEFWNHHLDNAQLLADAAKFPGMAERLDPYTTTQLYEVIEKLEGGALIAEEMLEAWILAFRARLPPGDIDEESWPDRRLHPRISAEFQQHNRNIQAQATIVDAVRTISNGGWNTKEEFVLKHATADDFERAIRTMEIPELKGFMRRMLDMRRNEQTYKKHFGAATDRFTEACKAIMADTGASRLANLITKLTEKTITAHQDLNAASDSAS